MPGPMAQDPRAEAALEAFLAGVAAADPTKIVRKAVRDGLIDDWLEDRERPKRIEVLAIGKGAARMLWGLVEAGVPFRGLGIAPRGVPLPAVDTVRWLVGEHPIPGPGSFAAGRELVAWAKSLPQGAPL